MDFWDSTCRATVWSFSEAYYYRQFYHFFFNSTTFPAINDQNALSPNKGNQRAKRNCPQPQSKHDTNPIADSQTAVFVCLLFMFIFIYVSSLRSAYVYTVRCLPVVNSVCLRSTFEICSECLHFWILIVFFFWNFRYRPFERDINLDSRHISHFTRDNWRKESRQLQHATTESVKNIVKMSSLAHPFMNNTDPIDIPAGRVGEVDEICAW